MSATYTFRQLRQDLNRDIDAYLGFAAEYNPRVNRRWRNRLSAFLVPSVQACWLYRLSHWLYSHGFLRLALMVAWMNLLLTHVSINPASSIGGGLYIPHPSASIVFQGVAGRDLKLFAGSAATAGHLYPFHGDSLSTAPQFGDNVSLGSKAFVAGPVTIGSNARIGFNAYVAQDVPAGAIVVARHVRNRVVQRQSEAGLRAPRKSPVRKD